MSVKKTLKAGVTAAYNPIKGTKMSAEIAQRDVKHKPPSIDTSAQDAAIEAQKLVQADLDSEENRRRKRLLSAATGVRAFRGSPLFRASPGDSAGRAAGAAAAVSGSGAGASYTGGGSTAGGGGRAGRGGAGGGRTLIN